MLMRGQQPWLFDSLLRSQRAKEAGLLRLRD